MESKIKEIISDLLNINIEDIDINQPIKNFEDWDSLTMIQYISEVSSELSIQIPFTDIGNINTPSDILKYKK